MIDIDHMRDKIVATKVIGDDCVPAGFETFSGRLPKGALIGAITWTTGTPRAPASGKIPGFLRVVSDSDFTAGAEPWNDLHFMRFSDPTRTATDIETLRELETEWHSHTWEYAFRFNAVTMCGYATITNAPQVYAVGDRVLRIHQLRGSQFTGKHILTNGDWVSFAGELRPDNTLQMAGGDHVWEMQER